MVKVQCRLQIAVTSPSYLGVASTVIRKTRVCCAGLPSIKMSHYEPHRESRTSVTLKKASRNIKFHVESIYRCCFESFPQASTAPLFWLLAMTVAFTRNRAKRFATHPLTLSLSVCLTFPCIPPNAPKCVPFLCRVTICRHA